MRNFFLSVAFACMLVPSGTSARAQSTEHSHAVWHAASEEELMQSIPARAPVQKERIETEMRSASGIVDERGHFTGGVVLITAGYSADGKYSHYLLVGTPLHMGSLSLRPGRYVFGWTRGGEGLNVHFFDAATGDDRGSALARQMPAGTRVEPFRITLPGEHALFQIGRFAIPYTLP